MHIQRRQHGFTLIEIAIVLVIIGLLLGGILKGQELITSARVRNLISQQDGIKAGFYGFQDRYRALPGDYQQATTNLAGQPDAGSATKDGDGDGRITLQSKDGVNESVLAWDHLTRAGFINGNFRYGTAGTVIDASTPKNPYGGYLQMIYDGVYGSGTDGGASPKRHNLKTGPQIPVEIAAEVDRKTDDGNPIAGSFQFSNYEGANPDGKPPLASCIGSATSTSWKLTGSSNEVNCGGATLL